MKRLVLFFLIFSLPGVWAVMSDVKPPDMGLQTGAKAPYFRVQSGKNRVLTSHHVKGRVTIIFYESKDHVKRNWNLKAFLLNLKKNHADKYQKEVSGLFIINCRRAWPFAKVWKVVMHRSSLREGLTIYGDWSGKMYRDYQMKDNASNIVIIDKNGIVRYIVRGQLTPRKTAGVKLLLSRLLKLTSEDTQVASNM